MHTWPCRYLEPTATWNGILRQDHPYCPNYVPPASKLFSVLAWKNRSHCKRFSSSSGPCLTFSIKLSVWINLKKLVQDSSLTVLIATDSYDGFTTYFDRYAKGLYFVKWQFFSTLGEYYIWNWRRKTVVMRDENIITISSCHIYLLFTLAFYHLACLYYMMTVIVKVPYTFS